jgi:diguanylate cyclase (GGDEF)-like protein
MQDTSKIGSIVYNLGKLPTLPSIAIRILNAVRNKETGLKEIGEILATDPTLSAEVLKAINSHFYSLPNKITSVPHAVNLLGSQTVKSLALSFSLVKNLRSNESNGFDYVKFWKTSLIGAVSAKLLTENILPDFAEDAFFLGLIHNIGTLAMNQCMPEQYQLVLNETKDSLFSCSEAENRFFGFNHMMLGELMTKSWGLPESFSTPILHHHGFDDIVIRDFNTDVMTKLLRLSSLFIDLSNYREKSASTTFAQIEFLAKRYGFQDKLLTVEEIAKQIHLKTMNVFPLFNIEIDEDKDYINIIEDARNELINLSSDFMEQLCEQKKKIEDLSKQAMTDSLTSLLNFNAFHQCLDKEIERAQRYKHNLCLIMADIDYFKNINDTYGHLAGDHVIKTVAQFFQDFIRTSDSVARYGGEEFAVILPEISKTDAMIVAERLREKINSMQIEHEGQPIPVSLSFGISFLKSNRNTDKIELIKEADSALYQAKKAGRNTCRCNDSG